MSAQAPVGETPSRTDGSRCESRLEVSHLQKYYGSRKAVKDVSLAVCKGEVVGLLGPNGAGKTTSFYMIVGLVHASAGDITIDGQSVAHMPMHRRARLGLSYLPQEASIFRKLNVEDNVRAVLELQHDEQGKALTRDEIEKRLTGLLQELRVDHLRQTPALALSGGERRRVEIARALATQPRFILLDEPFAGIDPIAVIEIQRIIGPIHGILTNRCYATGKWPYGVRNSSTGERHDPASIVEIEVPAILPLALFEQVQARLSRNNPKVTPPRTVNGPNLLAGLAICASCGSGMVRTGTARGTRSYTYYSCAGCHQKGKSVCKGRHIPTSKLDSLIIENVKSQLLTPERLSFVLEGLLERSAAKDMAVAERRRSLEAKAAQTQDRLTRLYRAIEEGVIELDSDLKARIAALKDDRDIAQATLERIDQQVAARHDLTPQRVEAFAELVRQKLDTGDVHARRDYLRTVISTVEVDDDRIRITGDKASLANVIAGKATNAQNVSSFVRKWRTRHDSNV